ncbi:hypothetical protein [Collinsella sp. An2]|uniref:hypothetical protein n=1 Tax=Collinsella sp. An2 TaxID=1965585 RepID=UPI000B389265|nr:hypothetical protein [Collinsella sp. An2]OUP09833.1 hypothetical protein B5F33_04410 [Collinsella sp. An2]
MTLVRELNTDIPHDKPTRARERRVAVITWRDDTLSHVGADACNTDEPSGDRNDASSPYAAGARLIADDLLDAYRAYEHISALRLGVQEGGARLVDVHISTARPADIRLDTPLGTGDALVIVALEPAGAREAQAKVTEATRARAGRRGAYDRAQHHPLPMNETFQTTAPRNAEVVSPSPSIDRMGPEQLLASVLDSGALAAGTPVYTVIISCSWSPEPAIDSIERLRHICVQQKLAWGGGVAMGCGKALPRLMRSPRLGMWRRPLSEAIDRLIAALRMDCPLDELDSRTMSYGDMHVPTEGQCRLAPGQDIITVRSPPPRWIYDKVWDR